MILCKSLRYTRTFVNEYTRFDFQDLLFNSVIFHEIQAFDHDLHFYVLNHINIGTWGMYVKNVSIILVYSKYDHLRIPRE